MSTLELAPETSERGIPDPIEPMGLGCTVLLANARWFVKLRWIVIALLGLLGLTARLLPDLMRSLNLVPPARWPWVLAGVLLLGNLLFLFRLSRLQDDAPRRVIEISLWLQIVMDLGVLTALVHLVGSTSTLIAFAYLFHIALACVLLPPRKSFLVTVLAIALYLTCVLLEITRVLPPSGLLITAAYDGQQCPYLQLLFAVSAILVWLVIWYLVSTLSEAVRIRDQILDEANHRVLKADQERHRQVLQTTHDLKVPFSGVESCVQRLRLEHWQELSEPVHAIIERIERRAATLRRRIEDILLLGDLRSQAPQDELLDTVDLSSVIEEAVEACRRLEHKDKNLEITVNAPPIQVFGNRKQFSILILNLVSNALTYSRAGGRVTVSAVEREKDILVTVSDTGIGIRADALPHIFDDYFRTKEAAEFNRMSTGLGLAIVKEIARRFGLTIRVTSEEGVGTTFEIIFPAQATHEEQRRKTNSG